MYPAGFAYPCQTLAAAAAAGASGGAVGGVVTVAVDCCYGPCKISLLVVKNSKKKREKIMHRGLETSASQVLHSHPKSNDRRHSMLVIFAVLQCLVDFGGGTEEDKGRKADNKHKINIAM